MSTLFFIKSLKHIGSLNIVIRDAKPPAYASNYLSRIFVNGKKQVKRNIFLTMSFIQLIFSQPFLTKSFSQRHSNNVFLTTFFSQRLSHNVFLTASFFPPLPLNNHPHYVILSTPQYMRNRSVLYKYPKISQIRLGSNPLNFANF